MLLFVHSQVTTTHLTIAAEDRCMVEVKGEKREEEEAKRFENKEA